MRVEGLGFRVSATFVFLGCFGYEVQRVWLRFLGVRVKGAGCSVWV